MIRTRIAGLAAAAALVACSPVPAHAVSTILIYNSPASQTTISVYPAGGGTIVLGPGQNRRVDDTNNGARVFIPADAFRTAPYGGSYSGRRCNSPITIDPPTYPSGVSIRTYTAC